MPATRLIATEITTLPGIRLSTGVARRQKNIAARYHIGQCGLAHNRSNSTPPTSWRNHA